MPRNRFDSPLFYNMLISTLDEINSQINQDDYQEALSNAFNINIKLEVTDWQPFPAYQNLLTKLEIRELALTLYRTLIDLKNNADVENNKNSAFGVVSTLQSFAHLFNMLEVTCDDPEQTKLKILHNTGKEFGLFGKTPTQSYDCNNNLQFIKKNDIQIPEIPATTAYTELVNMFNTFTGKRLSEICQNLFSTMDNIEKNDNIVTTLKKGEQNLFVLGYIERIVMFSNVYKEQFKAFCEELNQPMPEEDEHSAQGYNILNQFFKN